MSSQGLTKELLEKFPLLQELAFSSNTFSLSEYLPPIVGLISSMTDPDIDGDFVILVPSGKQKSTEIKKSINVITNN